MATTLTLNISIPDGADTTDTVAALRLYFATNAVPNPTVAQLRAALEAEVRQWLKTRTLQYRRDNDGVAEPNLS